MVLKHDCAFEVFENAIKKKDTYDKWLRESREQSKKERELYEEMCRKSDEEIALEWKTLSCFVHRNPLYKNPRL